MTPDTFLRAVSRFRDDGFTVIEYESFIPRPNQHTAPVTTGGGQTSVPPFYSENDSSDNSDDYFEVIETSSSDSRTTAQEDSAQDPASDQSGLQRESQDNQAPISSTKTESRLEEQTQPPINTQTSSDDTTNQSPDTSSRNSRPQRTT